MRQFMKLFLFIWHFVRGLGVTEFYIDRGMQFVIVVWFDFSTRQVLISTKVFTGLALL